MKRAFPKVLLPSMTLLLAVGAITCAAALTPTTVPFDTALSIGVAHNGTWHRWDIDQDEAAEIEDPVAAFQSTEQITDDLQIWADHQINDPAVPTGWSFYGIVLTEPMSMHVIVRDTQNRLGRVVVTDRDTGAEVGVVAANGQGSEIDGSVSVDPSREAFNLSIRARVTDATIAQAGADVEPVDDVVVHVESYGWQTNAGDQHNPCPAQRDANGPWGNPRSVVGKVSIGVPLAVVNACGGGLAFVNDDAGAPILQAAPYNLLTKEPTKDTCQFGGLPPVPQQKVVDVVTATRSVFQGGVTFLAGLTVPPFSQGVGHWPMAVVGGARAVLYLPYRGRTQYTNSIQPFFEGKVTAAHPAGVGQSEIAVALAGGIRLNAAERIKYHALDPVAVGDVGGFTASTQAGPTASAVTNLKESLTFELWGDKVPPLGGGGLMGGSGGAVKVDAWTTVPPPPCNPETIGLVFPADGPNKGKCTVELGKGWRWTITGTAMYYSEGKFENSHVPWTGGIQINVSLLALLSLKLTTGTQPCQVELQRLVKQAWTADGSGTTTNQNGVYTWGVGVRNPGQYRARAKRAGMGPPPPQWGDWTEFTVVPDIVKIVPLTAP